MSNHLNQHTVIKQNFQMQDQHLLVVRQRYDTWSSTKQAIRDKDLLVDDSGEALITEHGSSYAYTETQSGLKKLNWNAIMRK